MQEAIFRLISAEKRHCAAGVGLPTMQSLAIGLAQELSAKLAVFKAIVASNAVNCHCVDTTVSVSSLIMNGASGPVVPCGGGQMVTGAAAP